MTLNETPNVFSLNVLSRCNVLSRLCLLLCVLLICSACSGGRSKARLARIDRTVGGTTTSWDYRYDDSGRLEELRFDDGNEDVWEFSYDGNGVLEEIRLSQSGEDDLIYDFTFEDGRLVQKRERRGANYNADSEIEYDSNGMARSIDRVANFGSETTITILTSFDQDDQGRLVEWSSVERTTIDIPLLGPIETTIRRTRDFRYDDSGRLEEIRIEASSGDSTDNSDVEYEYDNEGRLAELFDEAGNRANLDYDGQGRIEEVDFVDQNNRYRFEYDEGTSNGAVLEPFGVPYSTFFDVEGKSFDGFDFNALTFLWGL